MTYILITLGFALLLFAANWLVDGASGLAKRLNVPDLIIGLTVVAFGTSAPELVVNLSASFQGTSEIAMTNILGSNIINTLVILGLSATIYPITSSLSLRRFEIPLSILAGAIVLVLGTDFLFGNAQFHGLTRIDGIVLLIIFAIFLYRSITMAVSGKANIDPESYKPMKIWKAVLLVLGGLAGLIVGGNLVVKQAVAIAHSFGISEAVIGVTVVALGTSLPELATSAIAAAKRNSDMALGNVIGSNIFNVFMILGVSSIIAPLPMYNNLSIDASIAGLSSLVVLIFILTNKKGQIKRWHGATLLAMYVAYLVWLLLSI